MIGIILASHGSLALAIKEGVEGIFGKQEKFETLTFDWSMGPEDFLKEADKLVRDLSCKEVIFLADLWGGTPFNQLTRLVKENESSYKLMVGLNLPMALEVVSLRLQEENLENIMQRTLISAKNSIKTWP